MSNDMQNTIDTTSVRCAAYSPAGDTLITTSRDNTAHVWNTTA